MPTTTRLSIPYPAATDPPNGPSQMQAIANALDNAAIDLAEGTLAARPAPSIRGRWYYATDVAILYRDSGSTWRTIQGMLGTDTIVAGNIAADAVGNSELAPNAVTNTEVAAAAAIAESKLALASDAAAGTASRRTLGSGATQAAAGNDSRFSDQRVPTDGSVTLAKLAAAVAEALWKPGDIKAVGYNVTAGSEDAGWLLGDGRAVSRTTFAALFAKFGTTYGPGDGSTTFNLPDCRGRVLMGKGTHVDVDSIGESDGLAVGSRAPGHSHTVNGHGHTYMSDIGINSGQLLIRAPNDGDHGGSLIGVGNFAAVDQNEGPVTQALERWKETTDNASPLTDIHFLPYIVVSYLIKT